MKKLAVVLLAIPALLITSCQNQGVDKSKVAIDYGYIRQTPFTDISQFGELSYEKLSGLISQKESFVLVIFGSRTCGCWEHFSPLLVQYANEYHVQVKVIDANTLEGKKSFGLYAVYDQMPSIAFFRRGKFVRQTVYYKLDENNRRMFSHYDEFVEYMNKNIYLPKMYYLDKEVLDNKISSGEEFSLYVARGECGDCKAINYNTLYTWSDKNKVASKELYIFDIDPWRPARDDPDYDEKMVIYNAIKTEYGLSEEGSAEFGWDTGYVPTFQKRTGSMITDMITVLNDHAEEGIVTSYFTEARIASSPILRDTGNKYLFNGKEVSGSEVEPWGSVIQSLQLKWHSPIVNLFLDTYVK